MNRARVLLAEDHDEVATQLRDLLESECDVVETVRDGVELIRAAREHRPALIVTDISMPFYDGLSAAAAILRECAGCRVIFVTVHAGPEMVRRAMEVGACGYVSKSAAGEDLLPAVRAALRGERFISASLATPGMDRGNDRGVD